jgi:hypothetical protein
VTEPDRQAHWQNVYRTRGEREVSWSQPFPEPSLGLIERFAPGKSASIVDIGGGASRLVDALRERGYQDVTVLDLSEAALQSVKAVSAPMLPRCNGSRPTPPHGSRRRLSTSGTIARRSTSSSIRKIEMPTSRGCIEA